MTIVVGIDPGIARTGYGIIRADATHYRYLTHGTIITKANTPMGDRLHKIYCELGEVLSKYSPQVAGIESLYFSKNASSAIPVAQARGVMLLVLQQAGVKIREFPPLEIKQSICGSGRADKSQVQELVRVLLGLSDIPKPDHAADALAAAICCINHYGAERRMEGNRD